MKRIALAMLLCLVVAVASRAGGTPSSGSCAGVQGWMMNHDDSFEGAHAWGAEGSGPPEFGAFAEQMKVTGRVFEISCTLLPRLAYTGPQSMTVSVREDDGGIPGAVLASVDVMIELTEPIPPTIDVVVPISTESAVTEPWCVLWLESVGPEGPALAIAADLNGVPGEIPPMTYAAPGLGFPEGWTDVGLVFEPTASLGIEAHMCEMEFAYNTFECFGGGSDGDVEIDGLWDFDDGPIDESLFESCLYTWPDEPGDIIDFNGWTPSSDSNVLGAGPEWLPEEFDPKEATAADVEGGVLTFYDPVSGGFLPGQHTLFESPVIAQDGAPDLVPGEPTAFRFVGATAENPPPELSSLQWIVGSRGLRNDLTWGPWRDLTFPISLGPESYLVPLVSTGSEIQIRLGVDNPTGILIAHKGKAVDKGKGKKKGPAPAVKKLVPQFEQNETTTTPKRACMTCAAGSCLAYWAVNGYPEILPGAEADPLKDRHQALLDSLKAIMEPKPGSPGRGTDGIDEWLKKKKVIGKAPNTLPDGRKPLTHERKHTKDATWGYLEGNLKRGHDVLLGMQAYKDSLGIKVPVYKNGHKIRHMVTAAEITTKDNKIHIKVANPHGKTVDEVTDKNKDTTYQDYTVEVTKAGNVRLKDGPLRSMFGAEFLCVVEIDVVRPDPPNDLPPEFHRSPRVYADQALAGAGGDTLLVHGYGIQNDYPDSLSFFGLYIDVPYYQVESPPGWTWEPLPALPPGGSTCEDEFGPTGIAWRTDTPLAPGESVSGFHFSAHVRFGSDPQGVQWTVGSTPIQDFGYVSGPSALSPTSGLGSPPGPAITSSGLEVWPNPAQGPVSLRWRTGENRSARVGIFDAGGRLVRSVELESSGSEVHEGRWDGRDSGGRRVPSGVYFARGETDGQTTERRLLILKR